MRAAACSVLLLRCSTHVDYAQAVSAGLDEYLTTAPFCGATSVLLAAQAGRNERVRISSEADGAMLSRNSQDAPKVFGAFREQEQKLHVLLCLFSPFEYTGKSDAGTADIEYDFLCWIDTRHSRVHYFWSWPTTRLGGLAAAPAAK